MDDDVIDPVREIRETGEFPVFWGGNVQAGIGGNGRKILYFPSPGDITPAKVPFGDRDRVGERRGEEEYCQSQRKMKKRYHNKNCSLLLCFVGLLSDERIGCSVIVAATAVTVYFQERDFIFIQCVILSLF